MSLTNRAKIAEVQKVNKIHAHATKWLQLDSNGSTCELCLHACNSQITKNGKKKVLTVDEVMEKLQHSDSEDDMSENDDSEDDFDGYLEEMEMDRWSNRREMDGNSDEENSSDDNSNSDEDLNNSDENLNREEEMERDVPPIPPTA